MSWLPGDLLQRQFLIGLVCWRAEQCLPQQRGSLIAQGTAGNYGKDQLCLEITELFVSGWVSTYFCQ